MMTGWECHEATDHDRHENPGFGRLENRLTWSGRPPLSGTTQRNATQRNATLMTLPILPIAATCCVTGSCSCQDSHHCDVMLSADAGSFQLERYLDVLGDGLLGVPLQAPNLSTGCMHCTLLTTGGTGEWPVVR